MQGHGDERVRLALVRALEDGPCDVMALLEALRSCAPALIRGREGVIHPILMRALSEGDVQLAGVSKRGLTSYGLASKHQGDAQNAANDAGVALEDASTIQVPIPTTIQRGALRMARGVRDPFERGRVVRDLVAHMVELEGTPGKEDGPSARKRFGSQKSIQTSLQRVGRGKAAICAPASGADFVLKFLMQEGPWIVGTLVVFFVLRAWVVDVYRIPSKSMVPALQVGDRIVVRKFARERSVERWHIWTFDREGKTYVKRMVGLPGETISIHLGDVFINGELVRKPADVNEAMRKTIGTWDFRSGDDVKKSWRRVTSHDEHVWEWDDGPVRPDGTRLHEPSPFTIPLLDAYATLECRREGSGACMVTLTRGTSPAKSVAWAFTLSSEGLRVTETVSPATKAGMSPVPESRRTLWEDGRMADQRGEVRMMLALIDGTLIAQVGDIRWDGRVDAPRDALGWSVGMRGEGITLERFQLDRDQHWSNTGIHAVTHDVGDADPSAYAFHLPENRFFFLGDNTTNSSDSRTRLMGDVHRSELIAPVIFKVWPPSRVGATR